MARKASAKTDKPKKKTSPPEIQPPQITILSDHPILRPDDVIGDRDLREPDGFELYARLAAAYDILRHRSTRTPITIAIYGDWGTGKSSAMRYLQDRLEEWSTWDKERRKGHPKVQTVWFDPWKYSSRQDVWRGLIAEVVLHCVSVENLKKADDAGKRLISAAGEFGLFLGRSFLQAIKMLKVKAGIVEVAPGEAIDAIINDYKQISHPEKAFLNEFESALKGWIRRYIGQNERLAIFIDDLDRCLPEVTLEVLEALKLYLNIPELMFIVGLDREVVDGIVCKHYLEKGLGEKKAREYLNKIFQVEIYVPPSDQQISEFIIEQIKQLDTSTGGFWTKQLAEASGDEKDDNGKALYQSILEGQIEHLCRGNPRQVKRLLNSALLRATAAAYNESLEGESALRFVQGAQVFLIQHLLQFRGYPQPGRLLLQRHAQTFFERWSQFIREYPIFYKKKEGSTSEIYISQNIKAYPDTDEEIEPSQISEDIESERDSGALKEEEDPVWKAYEGLLKIRPNDAEGNVLDLEKEQGLWYLLRIPFSIAVAASAAVQSVEVKSSASESSQKAMDKDTAAAKRSSQELISTLTEVIRRAMAREMERPIEELIDADLKKVTNIDLSNSDISDISALANLTGLQRLDLSNTKTNDISALANLTSLYALQLRNTKASDISALANLTSLRYLILQKTEDVSDISALANLSNLTTLNLGGTKVSDISVLAKLTKLRHLFLGNTNVSDVSALANLNHLNMLTLRDTKISDVTALENLTGLLSLNLANTNVSEISALAYLSNLTTLNLGGTQVSNISVLAKLIDLKELFLWKTNVRDISFLTNLTNLVRLSLINTKVSDISVLASLSDLQTLNLGGKNIRDISALINLTGLQSLSLEGIEVNDISMLANLTGLQSLSLEGIEVNDISMLANLTGLQRLSLVDMEVSDISILAKLTSLQNLNLWQIRVNDISVLAKLTNLQWLSLNEINVSDISSLENLTNLQRLNMCNMNVNDISVLTKLTDLKELFLRNTNVSNISTLANLTGLQRLSLDGTQVSDVSVLGNLTSLQRLSLRSTQVSDKQVAELKKMLPNTEITR